MSDDRHDSPPARPALSALMDGELDSAAVARLAEAWRGDPALRADWHCWHLAGDVLRSQDLAQLPGHDEAFLQRLRVRLAQEPVLVAPTPVAAPVPRRRLRRVWAVPALAAGFAAVAGVMVVARLQPASAPSAAGPVLAVAPRADLQALASAPQGVPVAAVQEEDPLLRDAQLDRYLLAHKQWGSSFAMPVARPVAAAGGR